VQSGPSEGRVRRRTTPSDIPARTNVPASRQSCSLSLSLFLFLALILVVVWHGVRPCRRLDALIFSTPSCAYPPPFPL